MSSGLSSGRLSGPSLPGWGASPSRCRCAVVSAVFVWSPPGVVDWRLSNLWGLVNPIRLLRVWVVCLVCFVCVCSAVVFCRLLLGFVFGMGCWVWGVWVHIGFEVFLSLVVPGLRCLLEILGSIAEV